MINCLFVSHIHNHPNPVHFWVYPNLVVIIILMYMFLPFSCYIFTFFHLQVFTLRVQTSSIRFCYLIPLSHVHTFSLLTNHLNIHSPGLGSITSIFHLNMFNDVTDVSHISISYIINSFTNIHWVYFSRPDLVFLSCIVCTCYIPI